MPTVDLFIMARVRCPFSGMHLERPVQVKFGFAQWDTKTVYEATKEAQVSAINTIAVSLSKSLEKEIGHALANVLRYVQIEALERENPKVVGTLYCHDCHHSKESGAELSCLFHLHPGVVALYGDDGWRYVTGCEWAVDCIDHL